MSSYVFFVDNYDLEIQKLRIFVDIDDDIQKLRLFVDNDDVEIQKLRIFCR